MLPAGLLVSQVQGPLMTGRDIKSQLLETLLFQSSGLLTGSAILIVSSSLGLPKTTNLLDIAVLYHCVSTCLHKQLNSSLQTQTRVAVRTL